MHALDTDGDGSIDLGEFFRHFGDGRAGAEGQFVPAPAGWGGARPGYCFRVGEHGLGYYLDIGLKNRLLMEGGKLKGPPSPGAWPCNRPCAQQYVGKSQSCMVISGRLIVHAPAQFGSELHGRLAKTPHLRPPTNASSSPKTAAGRVAAVWR